MFAKFSKYTPQEKYQPNLGLLLEEKGATYASEEPTPIATRNDDLSRQVRNLLLLLPVTQIEIDKNSLGPKNLSLFEGIDTLYLSFSLFDFISESMVFQPGASRDSIVNHLSQEINKLNPKVPEPNRVLIAEIILDVLSNSKNSHQSFSFPYFDAATGTHKTREFHLIRYTVTDDNEGWYFLTNDGFAAYFSMLEMDGNVAQEVDEYLIKQLIERGKFEEALRIAKRNRKRTIELKETLDRKLFNIKRDVINVDWQQDVKPYLDQSRTHIEERIKEEGAMLRSLPNQIDRAFDAQKQYLMDLQDTLQECQRQHGCLHRTIMGFNDQFLLAQNLAFRTPKVYNLANLEDDILAAMTDATVETLSQYADDITALMNPPKIKKIFDPLLLLSMIENSMDSEEKTAHTIRKANTVKIEASTERFSQALVTRMQQYLDFLVPVGLEIELTAMIQQAEQDKLTTDEILCLVYLILEQYGDQDESVTGLLFKKMPKFETDYVSGDNLLIYR